MTFALTLPADDSASDWIGTMTDFLGHKSHTKEPSKSFTSNAYTTTMYTVTACPTTVPNGHDAVYHGDPPNDDSRRHSDYDRQVVSHDYQPNNQLCCAAL